MRMVECVYITYIWHVLNHDNIKCATTWPLISFQEDQNGHTHDENSHDDITNDANVVRLIIL